MAFLKPKFMQSWIASYKKGGIKGLLKEKGWSVLAVFFLFYLVRDTILYIIIPWLGYKHFSSFF